MPSLQKKKNSNDPAIRVCLTLKKSLDQKVRRQQSKTIMRTGANCSYSRVVSGIIEEHFK